MIIHMVLFKWKETTSSENIEAIMMALQVLPEKIPQILELSCGQNFSERAKGFDHGLLVKFSDRLDLKTYATHPNHLAVVNDLILPAIDDILALDYEI